MTKILQLSYLHIGPHNDAKDQKTYDLIQHMMKHYRPDITVLTGDQIWSEGVIDSGRVYKELIEYLNQFDTQIATTFGNHDTEGHLKRGDLRAIEEQYSKNFVQKHHSLIIDDKEAYTIEVSSQDTLTHVLYVIDGGDYNPFGIGDYDFIRPEHVNWLKETYEAYQSQYKRSFQHNLLFTHIPLQKYREVENIKEFHGIFNEPIACSKINSGLFSQMLLNGDMEGMFCGHDHDNDFTINLYGIRLSFGRVGGYNTYGDLQRGARLIELQPHEIFKSKVLEFDDRY